MNQINQNIKLKMKLTIIALQYAIIKTIVQTMIFKIINLLMTMKKQIVTFNLPVKYNQLS